MTNYRYTLKTLCLDITRRCNLSCDFCARGPAQKKTMSKEIIDGALDQLTDVYVGEIRLSGGEPFLEPELIDYTVNGIIERNIKVACISIFTNGTVYDNKQIDDALIKAAVYLKNLKAAKTAPSGAIQVIKFYNVFGDVKIILSDYQHDNADCIEFAKAHYKSLNPNIGCAVQTDAFLGSDLTIELCGSAIDNATKLFPKKMKFKDVPLAFDNEYSFIYDARYDVWPHEPPHVSEIITISSDGTVTPGCIPAYHDIDDNAEFNILTGDLFEYLDDFCWRHPATRGMNHIRQKVKAVKILREKGIEVECDFGLQMFDDLINSYEAIHQILHTKLPQMPRLFIDVVSLTQLVGELEKNGAPVDKDFIDIIAYGYNAEIINNLLTEAGRKKLINDYATYYLTLPQRMSMSTNNDIADKAMALISALFSSAGNSNKIRPGSPQYFQQGAQRLGALMTLAKVLNGWN